MMFGCCWANLEMVSPQAGVPSSETGQVEGTNRLGQAPRGVGR